MAIYAAEHYGCRVDTTISEQFDAVDAVAARPAGPHHGTL